MEEKLQREDSLNWEKGVCVGGYSTGIYMKMQIKTLRADFLKQGVGKDEGRASLSELTVTTPITVLICGACQLSSQERNC